MTNPLIQKLDPKSKAYLRSRAKQHGRTIEEEARTILESALIPAAPPVPGNLGTKIRARFAKSGFVQLPTIPRTPIPKPRFPEE